MARRFLFLTWAPALVAACSLNPRGELPGEAEPGQNQTAGDFPIPDGIDPSPDRNTPQGDTTGDPALDGELSESSGDDGFVGEDPALSPENETPATPAPGMPSGAGAPGPEVAPTSTTPPQDAPLDPLEPEPEPIDGDQSGAEPTDAGAGPPDGGAIDSDANTESDGAGP